MSETQHRPLIIHANGEERLWPHGEAALRERYDDAVIVRFADEPEPDAKPTPIKRTKKADEAAR